MSKAQNSTVNVEDKRLPGRPKNPLVRMPTFDSQAQASAATGIPAAVFRAAKRAGCAAFAHGRIDLGELLRWYFSRPESSEESQDWGKELKKAQTLRERIKLSEDQARVLDRGEVQESLARSMAQLFGELDRVFVAEFPARAKGRDEIGIRDLSVESIERMKTRLRELWEVTEETQATNATEEQSA